MAKGRKFGGVAYTKQTTRALSNWKLDTNITTANDITKEFRKEINRVFHAVNRRLENLSKSGAFSPAAEALNAYLENGSGVVGSFNKFAKLSTAGKGLQQLKRDYAAAIEFLKKPTSTASGARTFENHVIAEMERAKGRKMYPGEFEHVKTLITTTNPQSGIISALIDSDPTTVMNYFTTATEDIADDIERAANNPDDTLDNLLKADIKNLVNKQVFDAFDTFIK